MKACCVLSGEEGNRKESILFTIFNIKCTIAFALDCRFSHHQPILTVFVSVGYNNERQ